MKKKLLTLGIVFALLVALIIPASIAMAADNDAGQAASTAFATTIKIVRQAADTPITTITFPEGAATGVTITTPYNDLDTDASPQALHATASKPVVRLLNGSGGTLTVTLEITAWTGSLVTSEDYELVVDGSTTVLVVDDVLSADGGAATEATEISIANAAYGDLYLSVGLAAVAGKSATSTLTVLGES